MTRISCEMEDCDFYNKNGVCSLAKLRVSKSSQYPDLGFCGFYTPKKLRKELIKQPYNPSRRVDT